MDETGYKKLLAWKKADELAKEVYFESQTFPKDELFGLTSQLRRAALSVPTNIAEGYGRVSKKELKRFVAISLGSLSETEYLLDFAYYQKYLNCPQHTKLINQRQQVGQILWKLWVSLKE